MANTEYYKGQTIDPDKTFLKIEGEKYYYDEYIKDGKKYYRSVSKQVFASSPIKLGRKIINTSPKTKKLEEERKRHFIKLGEGVVEWNKWREEEPYTRPILYELGRDRKESAKIDLKNLQNINFSNANLINADLSQANLTNANFHEANLGGSKLEGAILEMANFCRADLYKTDLSHATLTKANLQGSQLAGTVFKNATIKECKVYGSSAWDIDLNDTAQEGLEIVYKKEGEKEFTELMVNDLGMAQFLYFILNNKHLFNVFNSTNASLVLLLGRFQKKEKKVLNTLREYIRDNAEKKYVPVLFDFEKPESYDYTGVITVLAGMSKFIIADLTNPKSIPHELHAIVGAYPTAVIPIIKNSGERKGEPFSMFADYFKYYWVHPIIKYPESGITPRHCELIISEAENFYKKIKQIEAERKKESVSIENLGKDDK